MSRQSAPSRRDLLRAAGALVVSFSWTGSKPATAQGPAQAAPDLDAFLAIHPDGSVTIATSKVDPGTGLTAAYRQIAAEELGIPVERFTVVQGDTAATPNHGGTGGSTGVPRGGADIRRAAATARQALLEMAAGQLKRPAAELTIVGGEVRPAGGGSGVTLAALIGGRKFNLKVNPNAPLKPASSYTVVGKPVPRTDVPGKATGRHVFVHDHAIEGLRHGRVIRPPVVGARLVSVDESSVRTIPGVRVVRVANFLGVVAMDEWAAICAARELKAVWGEANAGYATADLERTMGSAEVVREQTPVNRGDATAALGAAQTLSASYYWPFHAHASLAPSCAVADVKEEGTTVWSSTQDTYGLRNLIARTFTIPPEKIRVVYMDGSGSYGSNGAYDAAADAVLLSRGVGAPVRVQWMRADEHAWDPKGPAQLLRMRGALNADGSIAAWESTTTGPAGPQWTDTLLGPTAAGISTPQVRNGGAPVVHNLDPPYAIPNLRVTSRLLKDTPLRTSNLRAPGKIATVFAVESFTDEMAAAAGMDPVEFRRRSLSDPRAIAVLERAANMIDWQPRRGVRTGDRTGRGIAYMRYKNAENYVAMAMEVAVDRGSGKITVRRIACAHDCGLIINPDGLRNQVEGNILHTLSRVLHEEVTFQDSHVTSADWASYPILRFPDVPAVQVALIDHPDQPHYGAGEAACAPVAAALANAVFDATGVRLRSVPFTPTRVKAALA
ncbi:MAG: molybdopterin cofactor-binding domain-containing protein [Candidatus Solibacter sp.]